MAEITFGVSGYVPMLDALTSGLVLTARLYTNDPTIGPATVAADFTEPVMDGYDWVGVKRYTPAALRSGVAFSVADHIVWQWTTGADPEPIRGVYFTAGPTGPYVGAWRAPGPAFPLGSLNPTLVVILTLYFPAAP